jgi:hypothetical protein
MIFFLMNIKTYLKNNMIVKNNNSHHLRVPKANKKFPEDNFAVRNWNFLPCVNGGHIYIYIYIYKAWKLSEGPTWRENNVEDM